jgi:hypothetical protein
MRSNPSIEPTHNGKPCAPHVERRADMTKAVIVLFFALMLLPHAHAAEINAIGEYCNGPCAYLKGEIKSGDLIKLKAVYESPTRQRVFIPDFKPPTEIFQLQLNSRGGSLEEAMEIGRWVRKNKIHTRMPSNSECFSSCVYIFAAGIDRVSFSFWSQKVGIHRPYLTQMPKEGVQVAMRKALADSRAYFAEMNVPEQLADSMFSVPPDKVEVLTDEKLSFYRLDGTDMAFEEEIQLHLAARFGMTRQEYMQNRKLVDEDIKACRDRRGDEKFDSLKCIDDAYRKYGLHESQRKQSR